MFGLEKFGDGIGLHRIARFFSEHDIDTDRLAQRSIVITGSNGKGSTARLAAAALEGAGLRAGCFTSPHLFDVRERFRLGDSMIDQGDFDRYCTSVKAFSDSLPAGDRMSAFEFLFLTATLWFEETGPDVIVWEAGLGGRYDPVRAVRAPLSVLTSVEREHTDILGATEELIAFDKIDALAPGGRLIVSAAVDSGLYERIAAYCALSGKTPVFASAVVSIENTVNTSEGTHFDLAFKVSGDQLKGCSLRLIGRHQADNCVAALLAASARLSQSPAQGRSLLLAMSSAVWPGRLERVSHSPEVWIDVGHTPRAIHAATSAFLDFTPRERVLVVFGVTAGKEAVQMAETVAACFDRFILARAYKAGADPSTYSHAFAGKDATVEADITAAARLARQRAEAEGLTILVLGGHFIAAEFQHAWVGNDPRDLEFM